MKNTSAKKKARKRLVRIIVLIPVSLILLLSIALVVLYFQQDRLVKLTVKELNKQLPGELVVGGSNISAFENFPYVSIRMNKVQFYADKQKTGKPIYEAERMYVGFSLSDIWNQKYHVKTIVLRNGHLDLNCYSQILCREENSKYKTSMRLLKNIRTCLKILARS